jgi:hypothetical protein
MKRSVLFLAGVCMLFFTTHTKAQTVGKRPPKVMLISYDKKKEDGDLLLKIDVKLADCIGHVEVSNKSTRKPKLVSPKPDDYYLDERNNSDIWLKLPIGKMNELLRRDEEETQLVIYSKTGKPVYQTMIALNKQELLGNFDTHNWR